MIIRMHRFPAVALAVLAAGCGTVPTLPGVTPHRIEIQQGNYISQEMVAQLKPGMTREQVRYVLGTPLVTDIFHSDRWDYVYFRDVAGKPREQRKLSVFFEDAKLARVTGDVIPAAPATPAAPAKPVAEPAKPPAEAAAPAASPAKPAEADKPVAEAPSERGWFGRMIDRLKGGQ